MNYKTKFYDVNNERAPHILTCIDCGKDLSELDHLASEDKHVDAEMVPCFDPGPEEPQRTEFFKEWTNIMPCEEKYYKCKCGQISRFIFASTEHRKWKRNDKGEWILFNE